MTSRAAFFALLALWGVGTGTCAMPAFAEEVTPESSPESSLDSSHSRPGLTDRVWARTEAGALPGSMKIFLSDGTLVQDSCWETHRLSVWQMTSDTALSWDEDGMAIAARIVSLADTELVLEVNGSPETYAAAPVPYLCPDMPKG